MLPIRESFLPRKFPAIDWYGNDRRWRHFTAFDYLLFNFNFLLYWFKLNVMFNTIAQALRTYHMLQTLSAQHSTPTLLIPDPQTGY